MTNFQERNETMMNGCCRNLENLGGLERMSSPSPTKPMPIDHCDVFTTRSFFHDEVVKNKRVTVLPATADKLESRVVLVCSSYERTDGDGNVEANAAIARMQSRSSWVSRAVIVVSVRPDRSIVTATSRSPATGARR